MRRGVIVVHRPQLCTTVARHVAKPLPATCCQRRAARTGNGTRDALLIAAFGCRTNCLRDPQKTGRIRRPSTTNSEGANVARERNVAKPSSLSLHTHCAVAAVVRLEVVPQHRASLLLVVLRTS